MDWIQWHERYEDPNWHLAQRLSIVRKGIANAFDQSPAGPIRVASMCAGDGRDLLGVLEHHPRAQDVSGRLVELDPQLADRARASAPSSIDVLCSDAGNSDAYEGIAPVNLLLFCGVFGNITETDILNTIKYWPMLCAPEATVIWTRGAFDVDIRDQIREWVKDAGFDELAFDGPPQSYGVGVARMTRTGKPYQKGVRFFSFILEKQSK